MHIFVIKQVIVSSGNGLVLNKHQAITSTNDGLLPIEPLGTNFNKI